MDLDAKLPDNILVSYPEQDEIPIAHPSARGFCDYCLSVKPKGDFADRQDFDVFKLRPWLGYIMILEYLADQDDFRYRMFGTQIAEQSGFDMTGRLVSDLPSPGSGFYAKLYRESMNGRKLVYSQHTRIHARYDCDWHRILCPVQAGGQIQIVTGNFPVTRPNAPA
jgi:hypothetical protein